MKERLWTIQLTYGTAKRIFGSLRYTDTMLTIWEYDQATWQPYEMNVDYNNPNKPTQLHYFPLHQVISFTAKAD